MDVVLDRRRAASSGVLEQRPDIDVEADIREGGGNDLGATVVAVLAILTTSMRGRRPSASAKSATSFWMAAKPSSPS